MERKNLILRWGLPLVASTALVCSCQDYEPFTEQHIQDVAYTHEFQKKFGEIDPRQDWDLFGQLARHIGPATRAGEQASPTITLLDNIADTIRISQSQHSNYRLFLPELNIPNNTYTNSNLGKVTQDFLTTARHIDLCPMHWTTSASDEIGIYWYVDEEEYDAQGNEITTTIMGKDEHLYYIKEYPIITGSHKQRIDIEFVYGDGTVSRTSLNGTFSIADAFKTQEEMTQENIVNQYLVSHPIRINIPDNISEYGFWIKNLDGSGTRYSEWKLNNKPDGNIEAVEGDRMSYTATFNINGLDLQGNGTKVWDPSQYLCFEDWINWGDADLNDLVFIARGLDDTNIIDNNYITEEAILVCEDLSQYDFDFNDVVLDLIYKETDDRKYKWVTEQWVNGQRIAAHWAPISSDARDYWLYVLPMAAGGWFESDVHVGILNKGEIHTLLKEQGWNGNPLDHRPQNAGASYTAVADTIKYQLNPGYQWNIGNGQGQFATHLSELFAEGFITLHCKFENSNATKIISSEKINLDKDTPGAPQMMLLPKYFEWAQEMIPLKEAYTGFSDWVADITKTSWILDTQVSEKVTDRGNLKPDNPQEEIDPNIMETVVVPFTQSLFTWINPTDPDDTYTYTNGIYISLAGIAELVQNDAKANIIIHYSEKPANIFIDDANGNLLLYDKFGDGAAHTTTYTVSARRFNMAVTSGGIWLLQDENYPIGVTKVEIELIGATDPNKRHQLSVTPMTIDFDQIGAKQAIDASSTTGANFEYQSSNINVAKVEILNGVPTVTAIGEGNCQIIVTAKAGNGYYASEERITVLVDLTPTMPLTVGEPAWHADITEGGSTYHYIYHRELTTYTDLSGWWTNGASITFRYEGYIYGQYRPNFFRVLNPAGTVIAGDFSRHDDADGDITYTISGANLRSCYDSDSGQYKFTIQYSDWDFNGAPTITSASITKIAN